MQREQRDAARSVRRYHRRVVSTESFSSDTPRRRAAADAWAIVIAFDCQRPAVAPLRASLADVTAVDIGRGDARAMRVTGDTLRIDLEDRWTSQLHACLAREDDGWVVEDRGSKNGTRVDGERVERARLRDGAVVEVGGTILVLRRGAPVSDAASRAGELASLSPDLERELAVLPRIARSRVPVLVRGESGTGKEVIARSVHALSQRRGPLVPVNCGAIPAALVEGELFGSRRGAFSGAEDRSGLVRTAEHGTLFLDEVVELAAASQAALLRFLQDGEITPLGSDKRVVVDVRVVAATNKPIEELVEAGEFRRDLYARLCGYVLRLPPLAARTEDLGLLIATLLARLEPDRPPRRFTRAATRALFLHTWPLNVRELEQVLRAALAIAESDEIDAGELRLEAEPAAPMSKRDADRAEIVALLEKHGGNISAVARALATSRTQVARLLARHGLDPAEYKRR
jgi:transcriptional regulator of acetoin/glycerol metabolism